MSKQNFGSVDPRQLKSSLRQGDSDTALMWEGRSPYTSPAYSPFVGPWLSPMVGEIIVGGPGGGVTGCGITVDELVVGGSGAMILIQTQTVGIAGAATIDFTSIPATYTHLVLIFNGKGSTSSVEVGLYIRCNGDTGSNYASHYLLAFGATTASGDVGATGNGVFLGNIPDASGLSAYPGSARVEIVDYANTNWGKVMLCQFGYYYNSGFSNLRWGSTYGDWNSTAAINQLTLRLASGNFTVGTRASLYALV